MLNEYQPSTQIQNQMIVIDWGDFAQGIIRKGMVACGQQGYARWPMGVGSPKAIRIGPQSKGFCLLQ